MAYGIRRADDSNQKKRRGVSGCDDSRENLATDSRTDCANVADANTTCKSVPYGFQIHLTLVKNGPRGCPAVMYTPCPTNSNGSFERFRSIDSIMWF